MIATRWHVARLSKASRPPRRPIFLCGEYFSNGDWAVHRSAAPNLDPKSTCPGPTFECDRIKRFLHVELPALHKDELIQEFSTRVRLQVNISIDSVQRLYAVFHSRTDVFLVARQLLAPFRLPPYMYITPCREFVGTIIDRIEEPRIIICATHHITPAVAAEVGYTAERLVEYSKVLRS